jgi:phosphomannomutase
VPELSRFFGIVVRMFYDDHSPPHFHASYGSAKVVVALSDLAVLKGALPPRAMGLLLEWALQHRPELEENWNLARTKQALKSIAPLE